MGSLFGTGRLANTGYLSILPVDQGLEHTAGASFAPNPDYFDPENIIKLAIEGGCNAVATTFGNLGIMARKYAHKIPFVVKINHNELLTYPNKFDQIMYGSVEEAWNLGASAVGATIYFGAPESNRQIQEVADAFERAHELGMATILWCYVRNDGFKHDGVDYHSSSDLTSQANHIGSTIQADIVKQKLEFPNLDDPQKIVYKYAEFSALIVTQRNLAKKWGPRRRRCCLRPLRGPLCRDDFAGTPRGP